MSGSSDEDLNAVAKTSKVKRSLKTAVASTVDGKEIRGLAAIHYLSEKKLAQKGMPSQGLVVSEEDDVGLDVGWDDDDEGGLGVDVKKMNFEMNHDSLNEKSKSSHGFVSDYDNTFS